MTLVETLAPPAIGLHDVTVTFPAPPGGTPYTALRDASVSVGDGEIVTVVGPTGCGKSTLLNLAAGLLRATAGSVTSFGTPLDGLNRRAGYMFQSDTLLPWLTARENVALGLELRGAKKREAGERAHEWLRRVGLGMHDQRYGKHLSGGMRRRVALAQMFALDPDVILMDEPFSALDVQTRQLMENELLELVATTRKSVLFVTHDLDEAIALADRVIVLSAGPETAIIGDVPVTLPRPRDVTETVHDPVFRELHHQIWEALKEQVMTSYRRQNR